MHTSLNGNLAERAFMDTASMDWTASPSPTVWRKRVHLVGPAESGQVTSVVRYAPHSTFHAHDHPEGEEILVLGGVFSDEQGDWPAGTYLLNPEGFRHAPFSRAGCELLVKLRQYPGRDRRQLALDSNQMAWSPTPVPGVAEKRLYRQDGYGDTMRLERWDAHTDLGERRYPRGVELFVLEGAFTDAAGRYAKGCWLRLPLGAVHHPCTERGCTLYVKEGGSAYLRAAD